MKSKILLLALTVAAFSSCTTAYKTGQTPDDVYYSPVRAQEEYVRAEKEDDRRYRSDEYYDDRYLRMKVSNRYRWNDLNDWYSYERYGSGYNYSYGNYYNPYNSWNYFYNPYCNGTVITSFKNNVAYTRPRTFNLNAYGGTNPTNRNFNMKYTGTNTSSRYNSNGTYNAPRNSTNTRARSNNTGTVLRDIFSSGNNNNNNSSNSTQKTNTSSSSSSSGSSGSSSGSSNSAPVRRF